MARKTSTYSPEQRAVIADIGRAAALMGLTQDDAAKRATEIVEETLANAEQIGA